MKGGFALCAAVLAGAPVVVHAQSQGTLPSRQQLQPSASSEAQQLPTRDSTGMFEQLASGPCGFAGSSLTFRLTDVKIDGVPPGYAEALSATYAEKVGTVIPVGDACRIRDDVARALLARNVLARVEIPEQKIDNGVLRIEVVPGHFETVMVSGESAQAGLVRKTLSPLESMSFVDLNVAQRYLLLASSLPGIEIVPVIRAGSSRGGLILEVHIRQKTVRVSAGLNNLNSQSQGRVSGYARLDFMGLTALGDETSLIASSTSDFQELQVFQIMERIHLNGNGLELAGALTLANGRPGGEISALDLRTRSFLANVEMSFPIVRHRRRNLRIAGGLDIVNQRTRAFRTIALSNEKLRVTYARISGDISSKYGKRPAFASGSFEVRKGVSVLGASGRGDEYLSRPGSRPDAFVIRASSDAQIQIIPRITFAASVMGQSSSKPLLSFEQLGVGNLSIGRGYDPNAVPGDRGIAGSLEARFGPYSAVSGMVVPFAFYDHARVTALGTSGYSTTLRSAGAGVRVGIFGSVNATATYAHPFDSTYPGGPKASERALLTISANFF